MSNDEQRVRPDPAMGPSGQSEEKPRRAPLPRAFGFLWFGEGVSVLGSSTTAVLIPLLAVVELHAGPGWMGALTAAAWLPWLVIGLPAGAWVDSLPARTVMIAADLVSAAALATVPLAHALGRLTLVQLLLVAFAGGIATVFFRTAYVSLIPQVVPDEGLETANARLIGTESAMQVAGPGVAGVIAARFSAAGGLCAGALGFLVSAVCLWRLQPASPGGIGEPASGTLWARIRAGVRLVSGDRNLRAFTLIGGISNFGLTGYQALLVLYLVQDMGLGPQSVGTVMMIGSCGGLLGSLLAGVLSRRLGSGRASTVLLLVSGPAALLIGLPRDGGSAAPTVAGLALVGLSVVAGNVVRAAWRQRYVAPSMMGRVVTASQMVNFGTMPLAGLVAGWLGAQLGVRPTILMMAGVHALACGSVVLTSVGRRRVLPRSGSGALQGS